MSSIRLDAERKCQWLRQMILTAEVKLPPRHNPIQENTLLTIASIQHTASYELLTLHKFWHFLLLLEQSTQNALFLGAGAGACSTSCFLVTLFDTGQAIFF